MKAKNNKIGFLFDKIRKLHFSDYMMSIIYVIKTIIKIVIGSALFVCVFFTVRDINANKNLLDYFRSVFLSIVPIYCFLYIFISFIKTMILPLWGGYQTHVFKVKDMLLICKQILAE